MSFGKFNVVCALNHPPLINQVHLKKVQKPRWTEICITTLLSARSLRAQKNLANPRCASQKCWQSRPGAERAA
jgi:hypothetical protein